MRATLAIALALSLAIVAPTALAHLDRDRPHIQANQFARRVTLTMPTSTTANVELLDTFDPVKDLVRHHIDPTRGIFEVEYRLHTSDAASGFRTRYTFARLLEYRDLNENGLYEEGTDPAVRSWRFGGYAWTVSPPTKVFIAGKTAEDVVWNGTIAAGPRMRWELGVAGQPLTDEGARVLPQDVVLYLDMNGFPPRGAGNLFAFEGVLAPPQGSTVVVDEVIADNLTVQAGLRAEAPRRLSVLDWGAQAQLDRVEQFVNVTLGEPEPSGNRSFWIHLPIFSETLHMVIVQGVEYTTELKRGPGFGAEMLLLALVTLGLLFPRRASSPRHHDTKTPK